MKKTRLTDIKYLGGTRFRFAGDIKSGCKAKYMILDLDHFRHAFCAIVNLNNGKISEFASHENILGEEVVIKKI